MSAETSSPSVCINEALPTIEYAISGSATAATLTSGAWPLGVSGNFDNITGKFTITGTPSVAGTYPYTVTISGDCKSAGRKGVSIDYGISKSDRERSHVCSPVNQPAGNYKLRLLNAQGQTMVAKQITRDKGTSIEPLTWDYKLARGNYRIEVTKPDGGVKVITVIY